MLTVWGRRTSSNVQAVMWCIGELGLPCTRHDVGHRYGGNDTPGFLAMNPNGLVPVLKDGAGEPLWESAAILRYLASRYAPDAFWPTDPGARAQVDKWAEWAKLAVVLPFSQSVFWQLVRTAAAERDAAVVTRGMKALAEKLALAEARLAEHAFLAGAAFTLADIQFGHVLYRYFELPITRPAQPALRAYYDRLSERPAYREHVAVPFEELRVT